MKGSAPDIAEEAYQDLAQAIREKADGRPVFYVPNGGNFADALLRMATKWWLMDEAIKHREVNVGYPSGKLSLLPFLVRARVRDDALFVFGGGGSWYEGHPNGYRITRFIARFTDRYLVLPSTFRIGLPKGKGTFYARGKNASLSQQPGAKFCHDMAFYLYLRRSHPVLQAVSGMRPEAEEGLVFGNKEAANTDEALGRDIYRMGNHMDPGLLFLSEIARYRRLRTDRLHVAIGAMVLGRPCILHAEAGSKEEEIYESSVNGKEGAFELRLS